jgi:hypothetical protein
VINSLISVVVAILRGRYVTEFEVIKMMTIVNEVTLEITLSIRFGGVN